MTPFGEHMRFLRAKYNKTLIQQANKLTVSVAYLSALEHGKRGKPSPILIDQICVWLGLIWDEAEKLKRLAQISHPKPVINTSRENIKNVKKNKFIFFCIKKNEVATKPKKNKKEPATSSSPNKPPNL